MKIGMVGTNFVSDSFMEAAQKIEKCEVVSVCSGNIEMAKTFADKYAIKNAYENYEEMFNSNTIEAVYIATPNSTHFTIAKYFLEHKIPTFCEKPLCSNVDEVKALIKIAEENKTYLHDGIMPLYTKQFKLLKEQINTIGSIKSATFNFSKYSSRYDAYLRGENPTTFRLALSNGSMMDLGVYIIADCVGLFGKPKDILASATLLDNGCDVAFSAIYVYDNFNVILAASKASNTKIISEICGEKGMIQFKVASIINEIVVEDNANINAPLIMRDETYPFVFEITNFIKNIENKCVESELVSHQLSIDISETLTMTRHKCGVYFPADK